SVRVVIGKRTGRASGNDWSPEGIARLLRAAETAARHSPEIPDLLPLPGPQSYRSVDADDALTANIGPEDRAREVARAIEVCTKAGVTAAGTFETGQGSIGDYGEIGAFAIANTTGLFAYHMGTDAAFRISALDGMSSGWAARESHTASEIDGAALARRAADKAVRSREAVAWEPGHYTVVLEPAAVADLLQDMSWLSFGALPVQEGRSFLSGRIGTRVAGENITLRDDPYHPLHRGTPFDAEGIPTLPVTILEKGVAVSPVYDRPTAAREGRGSTGHSLPIPNTFGPVARSLVLEGEDRDLERLAEGVDRGLWVTRVWYTNVIDPKSATLTGMTRDGLFAIEGGKVTRAIRNFRFNQSVVEMLGQVEAMSRPELAGGVVCPGLRVRNFRMSSVTEF
ncbi:MAG TPA: TldD/PmbA family protein, partial [Candidatus Eisenbacteria bacterium]|nr:TldD/PmbA family protein [Candidatus Eisenbacteria bacterium]